LIHTKIIFALNPTVINSAEVARHQWRRRNNLLQSIDKETDSLKLTTRKDKKNQKNNWLSMQQEGEV